MENTEDILWTSINPEVVSQARPLAEAGKYDDAIFAAYKLVEDAIQQHIGSRNIGSVLVTEAFDASSGSPKIDLSPDSRDREGARAMFSGALSYIRNDRGHKKAPFVPCESLKGCLLYLSTASFLLYLLTKDRNCIPKIDSLRVFGSNEQPRLEITGKNFDLDTRVVTSEETLSTTRITPSIIEALLPPFFKGSVHVVRGEQKSEERQLDTSIFGDRLQNYYVIEVANIPLYEDKDCSVKRSGVFGLLIKACENGKEFQRILPTNSDSHKENTYISHGPFLNEAVGETWFRDPSTGKIRYGWTSSAIIAPSEGQSVGQFELMGLQLAPQQIKANKADKRLVHLIGYEKDGNVNREIIIASRDVRWSSKNKDLAFVQNGILHGKNFGRTTIECVYQGFHALAEVEISIPVPKQTRTYFQGLRSLQDLAFSADGGLFFCNQSFSVFELKINGEFSEVIRTAGSKEFSAGIDCIAIDSDRNLYINDNSERVCFKFIWNGTDYGSPKIFADSIDGPKKGICVSKNGNVFVAVMGPGIDDGFIIRHSPSGEETSFPTRYTPIYLATNQSDQLLVPNTKERSIDVYDQDGNYFRSIPYEYSDSPSGIVVDLADNIYLPMFHSGSLIRISENSGEAKTEVILSGLGTPGGISMGTDGNLYISDFAGNTIECIYL